jgi:hypothetical protein
VKRVQGIRARRCLLVRCYGFETDRATFGIRRRRRTCRRVPMLFWTLA